MAAPGSNRPTSTLADAKALERPPLTQNDQSKWLGPASSGPGKLANLLETTSVAGLTSTGWSGTAQLNQLLTGGRGAPPAPSASTPVFSPGPSAEAGRADLHTTVAATLSEPDTLGLNTGLQAHHANPTSLKAVPVAAAATLDPGTANGASLQVTASHSSGTDEAAAGNASLSSTAALLATKAGVPVPALDPAAALASAVAPTFSTATGAAAPAPSGNLTNDLMGKLDAWSAPDSASVLTQLMGGVFKDGSLLSGPAMLMDAFEGGAASLVPGQVSSTLGNLAPGLDNLLSLDKAALPNALDVLNLLETLQTALPGLANTPGAGAASGVASVLMTDFLQSLNHASLAIPLSSGPGLLADLLAGGSGAATLLSSPAAGATDLAAATPPPIAAQPVDTLVGGLQGLLNRHH